MTLDQIVQKLFMIEFERNGLQDKLSKEQVMALMGVCHQEISKELEIARRFLMQSPGQAVLLKFYKAERSKKPNTITADINVNRTHIDIGPLRNVLFTTLMWEAVKGCRLGGHFAKLDNLANYYAKKWGNSADGGLSIDADINKEKHNSNGYN